MIIAQLPSDEELRLLDLDAFDILDTPAEREFDEIVELASFICNLPIALITLLARDRQWFKSKKGVDQDGTDREVAFCTHTILQDEVMEVKDALLDERFINNPLVTGDPNIRFYAGTPIFSPNGYKLGTICVLDSKPNELSAGQRKALLTLSNQITKLLELRHANKVIKKRAEALLQMTSEAARVTLITQETNHRFISHELHENMAQVLAACRMYLQLAEQNEPMRLSFITTVNEQLGELITSMRNLSTSLTPAAFSSIPMEDMLSEFLNKQVFSFEVRFALTGDSSTVQPEQSITCTRILEKWLEVLDNKESVNTVEINLCINGQISLKMSHDGSLENFDTIEYDLMKSSVYSRVQSKGGTIRILPETKNSIEVLLPLSEPYPTPIATSA